MSESHIQRAILATWGAHTRLRLWQGMQIGRLKLVDYQRGKAAWTCLCACGVLKVVRTGDLRGNTQSCGCLRSEIATARNTKHGMRRRPEYLAWRNAKDRCLNPRSQAWRNYGGRGITICAEWAASFQAFFDHVGPRPPGTELDRIDNERGYEPGNVRWTTRSEQHKNRRLRARRSDGTYA